MPWDVNVRVDRRAIPALLFALVWLSCGWFGSWEFNPNNSTRLFAAMSLAEQGDATIDEFAHLTIDKAQFGPHTYLDKAPGMTLLATPVIALAFGLTGEGARLLEKRIEAPDLTRYLRLRLRLATILITGLLTALATLALWSVARGVTGSDGAALFAALAYSLGTPVWGWSTTLFGHAPVAALWMIAVWAVWRGTQADVSARHAAIAGGALGWAVVIEYQAVIGGTLIALWALWRLRRRIGAVRAIGWAVAGGMTAGVALAGYNLLAFGTIFRLGYQGVVGFEGMQQGLFGLTSPKAAVLNEIIFGLRRGLIWVAPVLVLAPIGLLRLARGQGAMAVMIVGVVAAVLLVNSAYVYWDGGFSTGPRHSVPAIPMLALALAPLWAELQHLRARIAAAALLALSIGINLAIAAAEIVAPDTYHFPLWRPILAEDWPRGAFRDLPGEFWGWPHFAGMALYLVLAAASAWALWRAAARERQGMMAWQS